jgi:hypothetical protein
MILKIRTPTSNDFRWTVIDHVDLVSILTKKSFIVNPRGEEIPVEVLGVGPEYYLIEISRGGQSRKLAFSGVAFICTDEGRTLETVGGCDES